MVSKVYLLSYKKQYLGYISDHPDRCKVFAFTSRRAAESTRNRIQYENCVCKIEPHAYRIKQTYDNKTYRKPVNKLECLIQEHDTDEFFKGCVGCNVELLVIDEVVAHTQDYRLICNCRMYVEKTDHQQFVEKLNSLLREQ